MSKYRVAMVAACPFPCERGTPVRIHRMAEALLELGHEVHVITYHLHEAVDVHPQLHVHRIGDVPSYQRMSPGPSLRKLLHLDPLLARRLRRVLDQYQFDVIHAHHVEGLLVALTAAQGRLPIVYDIHTLLQSELPFYSVPLLSQLMQGVGDWIDRALPPRADFLIAVTDTIRDRMFELGVATPDNCHSIGNGVEHERFSHLEPRQRSEDDDYVIVFAGNMAPYQGVEQLLKVMAELCSRRGDVRLRIVSQSSFEPYSALASALGIESAIDLIPAGFDAVPDWLATSDIALNPRIEAPGLPQKTMNYMAAGLPVVSFAGSGQYLVDEETALLVEGGDSVAFAAAIERLITEPALCSRLGDAARHLVLSQMSWQSTASQVAQAYGLAINRFPR
jgi:glycosyltransferase involved in cell wall biosynthesis